MIPITNDLYDLLTKKTVSTDFLDEKENLIQNIPNYILKYNILQ